MKTANKHFIYAIALMRILCAFGVLIKPLEGLILSFVLDITDSAFLALAGISESKYNSIDKPLDLIHYFFILVAATKLPIFLTLAFWFGFRLIGHIFYNVLENQKIFILFPNVFEYLFLAFLIIQKLDLKIAVTDPKIMIGVFGFKLGQETYTHVLKPHFLYKIVRSVSAS